MNPEVQLPAPNGSLGHKRSQVNCAMEMESPDQSNNTTPDQIQR